MNKVDFFIIGAPKCGTTSLAEYLSGHPVIDFSKRKEPNFFSLDFEGLKDLSPITSYDDYLNLFSPDNHKLRGEGSTTYMFSKVAINNILDYNSCAKFIAILRNPVDMVVAWHSQKLKEKQEDEENFEKAWAKQQRRKDGYEIPKLCTDKKMLYYKEWGLLGKQIQKFFEQVPEKQRHIIFFEELVGNPELVYRDVLNFLGLPYDGKTEFKAYNQYKECRNNQIDDFRVRLNRIRKKKPIINALHRTITNMLPTQGVGLQKFLLSLNYKKAKRKALGEEFRKELVSEFYDDICLLEDLVGKDLTSWKK